MSTGRLDCAPWPFASPRIPARPGCASRWDAPPSRWRPESAAGCRRSRSTAGTCSAATAGRTASGAASSWRPGSAAPRRPRGLGGADAGRCGPRSRRTPSMGRSCPSRGCSPTVGQVRAPRDNAGPDWPPGGRLVHAVALEEGRLRLRLEVHADRDPTPAIIGWHPWFRRHAVRVAAVGREALARDVDRRRPPHERRAASGGDGGCRGDRRGAPATGAGRARAADGRPGRPRGDPRDDVLLGVSAPPVVRWPGGPTLRLEAGGEAAGSSTPRTPTGSAWSPSRACRTGSTAGCSASHRSPARWSPSSRRW